MANSKSTQDKIRRLFVGIKVNYSTKIGSIVKQLKSEFSESNIRWTSKDNFHITLAFIGGVDSQIVRSIDNALLDNLKVAEAFNLNIQNVNYFGGDKPRVLWLGAERCTDLEQLANNIMQSLKSLGIVLDDRAFNPHVTLGRIKGIGTNTKMNTILAPYANLLIENIQVKEVVLYESITHSSGPQYIPIKRYSLV